MSHKESSEERNPVEPVSQAARSQVKCRIPLRLGPLKQKPVQNRKTPTNPEPIVCNVVKVKHDFLNQTGHNPRVASRTPRPRSTESRPKSGSRLKEDLMSTKQTYPLRSARPDRSPGAKKMPVPRKQFDTNLRRLHNCFVPMAQRQVQKLQKLPNQETIKQFEELELRGQYSSDSKDNDLKTNSVTQIKLSWQDKVIQFENLKYELDQRQMIVKEVGKNQAVWELKSKTLPNPFEKAIMEMYATLREAHKMMTALGQQATLPSADDLSIMNVAKLTPDQLLQLCSGMRQAEDLQLRKGPVSIDMNKLYDMPTKLVATCEQTLLKRKEIIDWFETLKTEEKGVSKNKLMKKINEFNAENEMLDCSLKDCKTEFLKELNEIVDYLRRGVNETLALQLRTEELTYEVSELNSQNADLRKQLHACDHLKAQNNRHRVEELEKELKDEKCKKIVIKDRLTRTEGQVKIGNERALQLEAALEQARSQNWTLERTVQQLHDQNQKLQMDFDKELNNLTESIKNNTARLEEIADAREKLQSEKEDLEKRLKELSKNYNESLGNMKEELSANDAKLADTEKKFDEESEERKKLESKLESLCSQLLESELRYKDVVKQLQEKDIQLGKAVNFKTELEIKKHELEMAQMEIEDYKNRLIKQNDAIKEIERNFKDTITLEKNLRSDIRTKEEYITELEKKQSLLEQQLQDNEQKMESNEKQLSSLKNHMAQFQDQFGEFENINQLHDMLNQQRAKLLETTRQNGELAEALQKKDMELENHMEHLAEQENLLEKRDGVIRMLTDKEEEHANIIKLLRNNLEMRIQAETDLTQQLAEKNTEIDSLITNLETRKQQISQLEKIILTLEDQLRKVHLQKRKDQEKMSLLEKAVTDYETYHVDAKRTTEAPVDNLDNLIKILEDELGTSFEPKQDIKLLSKKRYISRDTPHKQTEPYEYQNSEFVSSDYQTNQNKHSTKTVMGNFMKKSLLLENDVRDNLDRKKAITNIDTQKWLPNPEHPVNMLSSPDEDNLPHFRGMVPIVRPKDQHLSTNLQYSLSNQRQEKKCKMFKLAGHRL